MPSLGYWGQGDNDVDMEDTVSRAQKAVCHENSCCKSENLDSAEWISDFYNEMFQFEIPQVGSPKSGEMWG